MLHRQILSFFDLINGIKNINSNIEIIKIDIPDKHSLTSNCVYLIHTKTNAISHLALVDNKTILLKWCDKNYDIMNEFPTIEQLGHEKNCIAKIKKDIIQNISDLISSNSY